MWTLKTRQVVFLAMLVGLTAFAGTAFCNSAPQASPGAKGVPVKPVLQIVLPPGKQEILRASSPGATRFDWTLQGKGKLSSETGDTVHYTAPEPSSLVDRVTVVAYNGEGASPPSSIEIAVNPKANTSTEKGATSSTENKTNTSAEPAIRLDLLGIPAAWMTSPKRDPLKAIQMGPSPNGCHTGNDCVQVRYTAGSTWAGVLWWPSACGDSGTPENFRAAKNCACAVNVLKAGKLRAIHRMTFWARGEHGTEVVEFKVGNNVICPSPEKSTGPLNLTADWQEYKIDIDGLDLTKAVALFSWVATDLHTLKEATFYLDDVQFEGER